MTPTTPSGIAIFQFRDSQGILISEASVPAAELIQEGRIFAEVDDPVNTGLAIANPNGETATIDFYFTDTDGTSFSDGTVQLEAHQQTAKFLDQPPFNSGSPVRGTFTFESSVPIAVIALRGFTNEAGAMAAAEILKLDLSGYPFTPNRVILNTRPAPRPVPAALSIRENCLCRSRSTSVHRQIIEGTRFSNLMQYSV